MTGETTFSFEAPPPGADILSGDPIGAPSPGADVESGVTGASSPDAINGDEQSPTAESLLEAISGVVEVTDHGDEGEIDPTKPPSSEPETESETGAEAASGEAAAPAETGEALAEGEDVPSGDGEDDFPEGHSDMPKGFRERLTKLQEQRDTARAEAAEHQAQVEQFSGVTGFIQEHDLAPEAVSLGLHAMAAWRYGDAEGFLKAIQPYVDQAHQVLGLALPPDLQEQVQQGRTTLDVAKELAKARVDNTHTQARLQSQQQAVEQQAAQRQAETIINAVTVWETTQKQADPDYAKKEELVRHHSREIIAEAGRHPQSEAEAIRVADEALRRANASIARLVPREPRRPDIRPGPASSVSSSTPVASRPGSLMEAAERGLRNANTGSL